MKLSERNRQALEAALPAIKEIISHARSDAFEQFTAAVGNNEAEWNGIAAAVRQLNAFRELETRITNAAAE